MAASSWAQERAGLLALRESAMSVAVALDMALGNQAAVSEKVAEAALEADAAVTAPSCQASL